jgi:signal transduction histidine kinase
MIIATVVIIVLSFCISFILSSAFSQDLRRLSDEAKRLSEDDYSVYFDEKGFSEAKELARTLNYATSEIRKTDELRRELISNVSHDLRTPLTIIKGYAEMIRDLSGDDAEKRAEQLDIIIKETDRLSGLVNDILQLSRAQNQNAPIEKAAFDLGATVKRVGKSFDLLTLRDGYDIRIEAADNCMVLGNEQQLELVVYNLIGNAVNYTGADKKVYVQVAKEKGLVMLKVRDTGAGMDEEQLRHIWQRYYRADEHIRSVVGTGLGLSIVQSILNRHEAQFGVESTVGNGSTFWFALPDVSLQEQA